MRLAALSIDLDSLDCYHRLHRLARPPDGADPVYGKAVERFGELCAGLGIHATAFAIGEQLALPAAARALRGLSAAGHEVANHSHSHDYALTRRPPQQIAIEVRRGAAAVEAATGRKPVGFRAPGYAISGPLVRELSAQGYCYDSSAFPAPPYWLAKAIAMALFALGGRGRGTVLDRPRALLAPRVPYHPSGLEPYARGELELLEIPVSTVLGFPLVGTLLTVLPAGAARSLVASAGRLPFLNLELHGIDFLDATDASPELARWQRDLRTPARAKAARLASLIGGLGREWVTLEEAAARLAPPGRLRRP